MNPLRKEQLERERLQRRREQQREAVTWLITAAIFFVSIFIGLALI